MSDDPLLRTNEAAKYLGIGLTKLRSLGLPSEGSRPRRYRKSTLARWLDENGTARDRRAEMARVRFTKHRTWLDAKGVYQAASNHPLYETWRSICRRTGDGANHDYGSRGIEVYPSWLDPMEFFAWIEANLGSKPPGHSLDRINNDGHYWPGNVRWADAFTQNNNRRTCVDYVGRGTSTWLGCICSPCPGDEFCPEVTWWREAISALSGERVADFLRLAASNNVDPQDPQRVWPDGREGNPGMTTAPAPTGGPGRFTLSDLMGEDLEAFAGLLQH